MLLLPSLLKITKVDKENKTYYEYNHKSIFEFFICKGIVKDL